MTLNKLAAKIPDISPFAPGWFFVRGRHPEIEALRRDVPIHFMARFPFWQRACAIILLLPYWPLRGGYLAAKFSLKYGKHIKQLCGKGKIAQFFEQWFLSVWYGIQPSEYHAFSLFQTAYRNKFDLYCYRFGKNFIADSRAEQERWGAVQDKKLFEQFCLQNKLACVLTLYLAESADDSKLDAILSLAHERPLFLKPKAGLGGYGCFTLRYLGDARFQINNVRLLDIDGAKAFLARKLLSSSYLVQPLLVNHPDLHDISNGSLCALRIITLLKSPEAKAKYLLGTFQTALEKKRTCNMGLYCSVDRKTGTLGAGFFSWTSYTTAIKHPVGGGHLAGRCLPFWEAAIQLALNAHTALGGPASLGWDVAICADGPVLLEANSGWDPMAIQQAFNLPLGGTRLPAVLKSYREAEALQEKN